jgi:hypothetical protein
MFGDYPPFDMTTYSQGGYTVSASSNASGYPPHQAFDGNTTHAANANSWFSNSSKYDTTTGVARTDTAALTTVDGVSKRGEWIQMEFPHKMVIDYVALAPHTNAEDYRAPKEGVIAGSNDGETWETMHVFTNQTSWTDDVFNNYVIDTNVGKGFKYVRIIIEKVQYDGTDNSSRQYTALAEIKFYGHKENDTTRFPVSSTVLKYPHIAMTGPAQRGYVATMSSPQSSDYEAWKSFDNNSSTWSEHAYNSVAYAASGATNGNQATTNNIDGSGTYEGEWIQIQFPQKVIISRYELTNRNNVGNRMPKTAKLLGSNDGSNWTTVYNHSDLGGAYTSSGQETRNFDVSSSTGYKYFRLITNELFPGVSFDTPNIATWKLYGTEEDLDIVARVGEGLDGKVANFRVYDKYLHEEQALELWDAQKDQFGRATSSVSVYKGHVGIGTTEPEAALTVMDEAHESEEFPPRAMTAAETYMEGHGVFKASVSSADNGLGIQNLFDKLGFSGKDDNKYMEWGISQYTASTGVYTGSVSTQGVSGEWLEIEMPYKIKLEYNLLYHRSRDGSLDTDYWVLERMPRDGAILGSNDGETWTTLQSWTNFDWVTGTSGTGQRQSEYWRNPGKLVTNSTTYYKTFRLVFSKLFGANGDRVNLGEWRLFGTRQGQSTLHDGELKLTKNLTVPRIGPPLDADDTPRRDKLVVEYNTSTNPTENGVVRDTSGRGNDSAFYGNASYNATEKALVFDGADDTIRGTQNIGTGEKILTMAMWVKRTAAVNDFDYVCTIGDSSTANMAGIIINDNKFVFARYASDIYSSTTITNGQWYHVVGVYRGGDWGTTSVDLYVDGTKETTTHAVSTPGPLNLTSNKITFGDNSGYSSTSDFDGSISNFKLYDVALTAEEVKRLYDMGRLDNVIAQPVHIAAPLYAPGTIVQVESSTKTDTQTTTSTSFIDISGLSVSIKPKFSTSKLLVTYALNLGGYGHNFFKIKRTQGSSTTYIGVGDVTGDLEPVTTYWYSEGTTNLQKQIQFHSFEFFDSANGTELITYQLIMRTRDSAYTICVNRAMNENNASFYGRPSSSITVKEVCQ